MVESGSRLQRYAELFRGFDCLSEGAQGQAEIEVGFGGILAKMIFGLFGTAESAQGKFQVVMGAGVGWVGA